ncbi:metal-dependent hydrolase [Nakamurella sp. YIM 132087]|uniref:Metal-dependent hydrolase n=1 Tax=Nakamurella alba TaxID=2665158 RepID=A0A7K1FMT9_9ACTN|nr:metal-dependent hydrolase [Nakamurella alba]MTD14553.1 metal-dependent hydrolase [Nakamurella alba]
MVPMPPAVTETIVEFPSGSTRSRATVLAVQPIGPDRVAVVTDRTCFHPVDPGWPDQGADRGVLVSDGVPWPVLDCVIGAEREGELFVGADVPVRRGAEGWTFVVVHLLAADREPPMVGAEVGLEVDETYRHALSAGHTACHLASLALNGALAGFWRKEVAVDGLGAPDFDRAAIVRSEIRPFGSEDVYRLGKSLRKSGFEAESAMLDLGAVQGAVNDTLRRWISGGGSVRVETEGPGFTARRTWVCELPEGTARILCGGTHLGDLGEYGEISVALDEAGQELRMTTTAVLAR